MSSTAVYMPRLSSDSTLTPSKIDLDFLTVNGRAKPWVQDMPSHVRHPYLKKAHDPFTDEWLLVTKDQKECWGGHYFEEDEGPFDCFRLVLGSCHTVVRDFGAQPGDLQAEAALANNIWGKDHPYHHRVRKLFRKLHQAEMKYRKSSLKDDDLLREVETCRFVAKDALEELSENLMIQNMAVRRGLLHHKEDILNIFANLPPE